MILFDKHLFNTLNLYQYYIGMSISISVICRKNRVSVKNKVTPCIRMIQDRKASYVSIGFALNVEYWDFENQKLSDNCPVKEHYQQLIDEKLKEFNKKIIYLEALGYEVTMDNLLGREGKNHNTVFVYFRKIIDQLKEKGTIRTAGKYESCLQSLIAFKSLDISFLEINLQFLNEFEIFLRKKGNVSNTIATKFSVLKAVYNKAIEDKIFICRENPFKKFKVGRLWTPTRKRAISKDEVLKIVNLDLSLKGGNISPYLEFARDIFLFSYYTAGINFKDIANLKYEGTRDPLLSGGLNTRVSYKNISLSMLFAFGLKNVVRLPGRAYVMRPADDENANSSIKDRWRPGYDNTGKVIPALSEGSAYISTAQGNFYATDWYNASDKTVIPGDYLRFRNLMLEYQLPVRWTDKVVVGDRKLGNVTLKFQAQNLFVIADKRLKGYDPETINYTTTSYGSLPLATTFTLGLNINF